MLKKLYMANWKMYHTNTKAKAFAEAFLPKKIPEDALVAICAPYSVLYTLHEAFKESPVALGAEDFYLGQEGAVTGAVALPMLEDCGLTYVLVGHSERRSLFGEDDLLLRQKYWQAARMGYTPVLCVGEPLEVREKGEALSYCEAQLEKIFSHSGESADGMDIVVAYEPIWAIGTGKTASPEDAEEMAKHLTQVLEKTLDEAYPRTVRILYGGSVKAENVQSFMAMPHIGGALVGGASLEASRFHELIEKGQSHV